jgi:hypothetical protein
MSATSQSDVLHRVLKFGDDAISALDRESVPVYLFITERFASTSDISSDYLFQFLFRSYYRLDNAGLGNDFKLAYFQLLQNRRADPRPDLRQLCEALRPYETKKRKQALQFSFATKLLATIDQEQPLYDSSVASVFDFNPPYQVKDFSKRLERFMAFYELLTVTSRWLAGQPKFAGVNAAFAKTHAQWDRVPLMKQVDFILWATGKAMKKGASQD